MEKRNYIWVMAVIMFLIIAYFVASSLVTQTMQIEGDFISEGTVSVMPKWASISLFPQTVTFDKTEANVGERVMFTDDVSYADDITKKEHLIARCDDKININEPIDITEGSCEYTDFVDVTREWDEDYNIRTSFVPEKTGYYTVYVQTIRESGQRIFELPTNQVHVTEKVTEPSEPEVSSLSKFFNSLWDWISGIF